MKIDTAVKEKINARTETIFTAFGVCLKNGKALCPFHDDKNASFIAKPDRYGRWKWKCMACNHKGSDIFSFVAQMHGLDEHRDFNKVAKLAAQLGGMSYLIDETDFTAVNCRNCRSAVKKELKPPRYLNVEAETMHQEYTRTNLYKYLCSVFHTADVDSVMQLYKVGRGYYINRPNSRYNSSDDYCISSTPDRLQNTTNCSSFPCIDIDGNVHSVKILPYSGEDGHRLKGQNEGAEVHTIKPEENRGTYFGAHLLPIYPEKPVAIVESEKTAVIGTLFKPEYIWIAVGGLQFFDPDSVSQQPKLADLKERALHIFPDADGMEEWKSRTRRLQELGYMVRFREEVISLLPSECKYDIADVIIWTMNKKNKKNEKNNMR